MIHLYGIPTCGSVRKGLSWMKAQNAEVTFHNFRKEGLAAEELDRWLAKVSPEVLLNRRGQTWRTVDEDRRTAVKENPALIRDLLLEMPGLIKRPVIVFPNGVVTVGVDEALWEEALKA